MHIWTFLLILNAKIMNQVNLVRKVQIFLHNWKDLFSFFLKGAVIFDRNTAMVKQLNKAP